MGERVELIKKNREVASVQNKRQDNITRKGATQSAPNNPFTNPKRDNFQTYTYDYFSGTDCKVFFGDIWVDDISSIQYSVNQSKTPIWGYASQNYDAIAKGQILVQGNLSIQFKETGYLNVIQNLLETEKKNYKAVSRAVMEKHKILAEYGVAKYVPGLEEVQYAQDGTVANLVRQNQTVEQILKSKLISTSLSKDNTARDFEDFAELLEDTIWGDQNGRPYTQKNKLLRADEFDYNENGGITIGRNDYANVLNILLTFGDINDYRAEHTLVAINDVHFQSSNMIVTTDGTPIAENYTFFARDINKSITNTTQYKIDPIKLSVGVDVDISKLEDIAAIEKQLVKDQLPNSIRIDLVAALPRNGVWKPITDGSFFTFDQRYMSSTQTYADDEADKETRLENKRRDLYSGDDNFRATEKVNLNLQDRHRKNRESALESINANKQFVFNGYEPLIDQIIKLVEREFNESNRSQVDLENSQYIAKCTFETANASSNINIVLEQSIPQTRTYKVIAPTRQNYGAATIITREDYFSNIQPITEAKKTITAMSDNERSLYRDDVKKRQDLDYKINELNSKRQTRDTKAQIEALKQEKADVQKDIDVRDININNLGSVSSRIGPTEQEQEDTRLEAARQKRIQDSLDYQDVNPIAAAHAPKVVEQQKQGMQAIKLMSSSEIANINKNSTDVPLIQAIDINNRPSDPFLIERNFGLKDGIKIEGVSDQTSTAIGLAAASLQKRGETLIVTAIVDGKHSTNSLHYQGDAFDVRTSNMTDGKNILNGRVNETADILQQELGESYNVVLESDHIHVEYDPTKPNRTGKAYIKLDDFSNVPKDKEQAKQVIQKGGAFNVLLEEENPEPYYEITTQGEPPNKTKPANKINPLDAYQSDKKSRDKFIRNSNDSTPVPKDKWGIPLPRKVQNQVSTGIENTSNEFASQLGDQAGSAITNSVVPVLGDNVVEVFDQTTRVAMSQVNQMTGPVIENTLTAVTKPTNSSFAQNTRYQNSLNNINDQYKKGTISKEQADSLRTSVKLLYDDQVAPIPSNNITAPPTMSWREMLGL